MNELRSTQRILDGYILENKIQELEAKLKSARDFIYKASYATNKECEKAQKWLKENPEEGK